MKLSSLPIAVDLAKRLFDLGIRYDSVFYWYQEKNEEDPTLFEINKNQSVNWKQHIGRPSNDNRNILKEYAAYTCNELGEMLPAYIDAHNARYFLELDKTKEKWSYCYLSSLNEPDTLGTVVASTEQDARAMLLIQIIEKKYIDISQTIIK